MVPHDAPHNLKSQAALMQPFRPTASILHTKHLSHSTTRLLGPSHVSTAFCAYMFDQAQQWDFWAARQHSSTLPCYITFSTDKVQLQLGRGPGDKSICEPMQDCTYHTYDITSNSTIAHIFRHTLPTHRKCPLLPTNCQQQRGKLCQNSPTSTPLCTTAFAHTVSNTCLTTCTFCYQDMQQPETSIVTRH